MKTRAKSEIQTDYEGWLAFWTTVGLDDPFHDVKTIRNLLLQKETEAVSEAEPAESPKQEAEGKNFLLKEGKRISTWFDLNHVHVPIMVLIGVFLIIWGWIFSFTDELKLVAEKVNLSQSLLMTKAEAVVENGLVQIPLDLIREKKLVSFEYKKNETQVPLLAYITPAGKIVTAVGLSEPCNSKSFHLEGNEIVCNLCSTRWDLETLKGTSGECADHSMDILTHAINKERLTLREADIQNWKPRFLRG